MSRLVETGRIGRFLAEIGTPEDSRAAANLPRPRRELAGTGKNLPPVSANTIQELWRRSLGFTERNQRTATARNPLCGREKRVLRCRNPNDTQGEHHEPTFFAVR